METLKEKMAEKCYICKGGYLEKRKVDYKLHGISLGKFDAKICNKCKKTFFNEETSRKMTKIVKNSSQNIETIKKEKNRSQSQTIALDIKLSIFTRDNTKYTKQVFKAFDRIKPGSHSRAIALDLKSIVSPETHGFEVSHGTPVPGVLIIKKWKR